jgi:TonB-linked SusC/RagA family outer membrane protein
MKKLNILQHGVLLIRGCSKKTFRIIRLTTLLLMVTVFNVFGGTTISDYTNLNLDKETDPAAIMQQNRVTGTVNDKSGTPLPGVNVVVTGTTQGTISDIAGKYSIDIPTGSKSLTFTFIGMETQEISIGTLTQINVTMAESAIGLEEVVVVGYGSQKKRDVIGSIATIKAAVLETPGGATNFASLLQGQAAGVSIQSQSGRLGAGIVTMIRGLSSISAETAPLYIIDGVPVFTGILTGGDGTTSQSPMTMINQADIESIQVLKDAAATSIYGSRGSNGVIMITTKTGVAGKKAMFNVDYTTGMSDLPFQKVKFVNAEQLLQIRDEAKINYGLAPFDMMVDYYSKKPYATEFLTREQAVNANTDWFKAVMRKGSFQDINVSSYGGDQSIRYYVSGNYRNDNGVHRNENLERYGLRANIDIKPVKGLDLGTKVNLSLSKNNRGKNNYLGAEDGNKTGDSGGFGYINASASPFDPVYSLADPKQYFNIYAGNPAASEDPKYLKEELDVIRMLASIYAEYAIPGVTGLSVRSELSLDIMQANRNFWMSKEIRKDGSIGKDNASTAKTFNFNAFAKYSRTFGDHTFDLVAGSEAQKGSTWYRVMEGLNLVGSYQQLGTPTNVTYINSALAGEGMLKSYFGRANYKFKDKYLAGFSIRRDGSSNFTSAYRWGNFMAFSAGWILSEESFMGDFGKKHFLKLRGSFGQTGNAGIPSNLDVSQYTTTYDGPLGYGDAGINGNSGTLLETIGVSNLTWETTNNSDIGLDFGFFNQRIDGSIAYYNKYVRGLLLATTLPPSSGISSIWGNIGDLVNRGLEFSVTSNNVVSGNLKWTTSLNISFNKNEVKKLTAQVDKAGTGMIENPFITKVGYGVRDFYIADWAGINTQTGLGQIYALDQDVYNATGETQRLKDAQGKDVIILATNSNNNTNLFHFKNKNTIPKYYGGITNKFTYKAFDFSFLITFSGGNYILDNAMRNLANPNQQGIYVADFVGNYWKKPGDIAQYQRLDYMGNIKLEDGTTVGMGDPRTNTSHFLYKADYIKLKSINVGFTLPKYAATQKVFQSLRIYASVENIHTFTKYPGWDPEGMSTGDSWNLPQLFSASIGISIKF